MDDREQPIALPQAPGGVELRHLRAFVAVAEELNVGRAAARLYISPPALSRQIRSLEDLLGCELLRRTTHRMELTLAGDALLERTRELLRDLDDAVAAAQSVGDELTSRVAQLWEPLGDLGRTDAELEQIREAYEALHARYSPPQDVTTRAVSAGGVPSLLLEPPGERPATLLHLHGGGYVTGSAFGYRHLVGALAAAAETGALAPDYRLAPEHPFPAAVDDALHAYLWLLERGAAPAQVTVAGDSSGGGLALSLLLRLREEGLLLPGGALLLTPALDLGADASGDAPEDPAQAELQRRTRRAAASYLRDLPPDTPAVDPLRADLSGLCPLLIQAATGDVYAGDAHRLHERAREHGVDARLELYPTSAHGFHSFWTFLPEAADAIRSAGRFARDLHEEP